MIDIFKLRQARERKALSQRDLSEMSGVAQATIAQLERGQRTARPTTVRKLSQALGVQPSDLLTDRETVSQEGRASNTPSSWRRRVRGPEQEVSISARHGQEHKFGSLVEAYVAGWDIPHRMFLDLFGSAHTNVTDRYDPILSKLGSDDPEQLEEAADLALFVANNIARSLEEDGHAQRATLEKDFEALPRSYFEDPTSVTRMVKLWRDIADHQAEAQRKGAKAIQDLISLHGEAVYKLSTVETNAWREGRGHG